MEFIWKTEKLFSYRVGSVAYIDQYLSEQKTRNSFGLYSLIAIIRYVVFKHL